MINYDVYRYRYTDFLHVAGVFATEEQRGFRYLIQRFTQHPDELAAAGRLQEDAAPQWGFFDGRCSERILDFLKDRVRRANDRPAHGVNDNQAARG